MKESKPVKVNNTLIAVVAIFAIFLITYFAMTFNLDNNLSNSAYLPVASQSDAAGLATGVLTQSSTSTQNVALSTASCKLIVGQTTLYDDTTLAVTLEIGGSTYYSGNTVTVTNINSNGCVVDISGTSDYLAIGQIQKVGSLYVTVKDVVQ